MAPKLTLIILACAVAVCNAEAPFRGYSSRLQQQQQQAAPYPASGFRPERTFNLPTGEAIAQQLRLAQIKKLQQQYQQQQQFQQQQQQQFQQQQPQQQQQQTPSQYYGTPSESEASQSQFPQQPSGLYGAPQEEASNLQPSDFTRPQQPSQQYGAPEETSASQLQGQFLRPQQSTSQRQIQFQRPQQPSRQYGAPINKAISESSSGESLEESKDVESVAPLDKKSGRLTQSNQQRDIENEEAETATKSATAAATVPAGFVLVPITAAPAGYTPQKLALFQAPAQASFAKIQLPNLIGLQQQKLLATPQLLAQQSYYQPQQFAFAAPLQAW